MAPPVSDAAGLSSPPAAALALVPGLGNGAAPFAVERLLILAPGREVTAGDVERLLPNGTRQVAGEVPRAGTFDEFKQRAERDFLLAKLREFHWNVAETARALDMPRSNLYKKIEKYALSREER